MRFSRALLNTRGMITMGALLGAALLAPEPARSSTPDAARDAAGGSRARDIGLCAPFGVDWCELFGVRAAFPSAGDVLEAGTPWSPRAAWFTNTADGLPGYPLVYPSGYQPAETDPRDDFIAKLEAVTVVIDEGTDHERIHIDEPPAQAFATYGEMFGVDPADEPYAVTKGTIQIPVLHPLSIGQHSVRVLFTMREAHCDGITTDPDQSCLPAGTFCVRGCFGQFVIDFVPRAP